MKGFIFREAYLWREICISKSIGLVLQLEGNLQFLLNVLLCISGQFPSTSPRGAYIWRVDLTEGFLHYEFRGLIHGGAYFRNFTVFQCFRRSFSGLMIFFGGGG